MASETARHAYRLEALHHLRTSASYPAHSAARTNALLEALVFATLALSEPEPPAPVNLRRRSAKATTPEPETKPEPHPWGADA